MSEQGLMNIARRGLSPLVSYGIHLTVQQLVQDSQNDTILDYIHKFDIFSFEFRKDFKQYMSQM